MQSVVQPPDAARPIRSRAPRRGARWRTGGAGAAAGAARSRPVVARTRGLCRSNFGPAWPLSPGGCAGFAGRAPFVAGYESAGGSFDEARFEWWKVEGTLRWAVGLAGQTMAFIDGRVPNIVMAASGRRVSELEWDLLMLIRPR